MKAYIQDTENKLKEISEAIMNYDYDSFNSIGLLGGLSGIMMFLFHYARYTKDEKYADKAVLLLYKSMDLINDDKADYSFSTGVSGFGWALEHLAENDFIDKVDVLYTLDECLCEFMLKSSKEGYWDALHGGIGVAFYLFYRLDNKAVFKDMEAMVEILDHQAIPDKNGVKWISINRLRKELSFNFGLAHGMPSIIVFLKKCIDNNIKVKLARDLMEKAIQYVLSNKSDQKKSGNFYPMCILDGNIINSERLAWCYGDPGILISFIQANKILKSLDKEIYELTKFILTRKNLIENKLHDACLCHGTAGMVPIFQMVQKIKYLKEYVPDSIIEYWVDQTIKSGNAKDGLAGYKSFSIVEHQPVWTNEIGFLDGVTGTAFCLLSYLDKDISWSRCLMIS